MNQNEASQLKRVNELAKILDAQFQIGGIRVGWDAIIGLVPGIGDAVSTGLSLYIVMTARQLGASWVVIFRMLLNVLVEAVLGSIPLVGDVFDIFWRANLRNMGILQDVMSRPRRTEVTSGLMFAAIVVLFVMILLAAVAVPVWIVLQLMQ